MTNERRAKLEAMGERDAERLAREYPRSWRYIKRLRGGEGTANVKRELDRRGGWHGMLREEFPGFIEEQKCTTDAQVAERQRERFHWSQGFERRAIEIALYGLNSVRGGL